MANFKMTQSRFFCTQCGKEGIPILRKVAHQRENRHLKKLYCTYCKEEINHAEVREGSSYTYEDFVEEFNLGRFKNDGTRDTVDELVFCSKIDCPFNRDGKCWNSSNSANCKHKI
jgi:hypothetical protein